MEVFIYMDENIEAASPSDPNEVGSPGDASEDIWSQLTSFDSGDTNYYTCSVEADSSASQLVAICLDIRNILLIFLLLWVILSFYYRLKNTINSYMR